MFAGCRKAPFTVLAGDNRDLRDVVVLERVAILGVGDRLRRLGLRARQLNQHDRDEQDENPEGERLGEASPAEFLLVFGRHWNWHYCRLAMYGMCRKFSA